MSREFPGYPQPVLDLVLRVVHVECILGGPEFSCPDCAHLILEAFDTVYGALPDQTSVLLAIVDDLSAADEARYLDAIDADAEQASEREPS